MQGSDKGKRGRRNQGFLILTLSDCILLDAHRHTSRVGKFGGETGGRVRIFIKISVFRARAETGIARFKIIGHGH